MKNKILFKCLYNVLVVFIEEKILLNFNHEVMGVYEITCKRCSFVSSYGGSLGIWVPSGQQPWHRKYIVFLGQILMDDVDQKYREQRKLHIVKELKRNWKYWDCENLEVLVNRTFHSQQRNKKLSPIISRNRSYSVFNTKKGKVV